MSDYIKREDALIILKTLNGDCIRITGRPSQKISDAITRVKNLPAEDVVERRKCGWTPLFLANNRPYCYECSNCGALSGRMTSFCLNCGADMRGEA